MSTRGLDMNSQRRLHLLEETTPGVYNTLATPNVMTSLKVERSNNEQREGHRPSGYNADAWHALLMKTAGLSGTAKPDFLQMRVLLRMLCGEPAEVDTATPNQETEVFYLPESGARNILTYSGELGVPTSCERLLYLLMQSFSCRVVRGNQPAIESNVSLLALKPDAEGVTMSGGVNESQTVTITGTPTGGNFTLSVNVDGTAQTTANIPYNATAAQVDAALEALSDIPAGSITATGGPLPATPVVVTFQNELGGENIPQMTASGAGLTGGTAPAVVITTGTQGEVPSFDRPAQFPMLPQMFSVRRAAMDDYASLAASSPIPKVNEIQWGHDALADPHMFFDEGDVTSDSHVDGAEPQHTLSLALAYNNTEGSACRDLTDKANTQPSTPEWFEVRALHPDAVHKFTMQGLFSVREVIEHSAAGNVYQKVFPLGVVVNDEFTSDDGPAMLRFALTYAV